MVTRLSRPQAKAEESPVYVTIYKPGGKEKPAKVLQRKPEIVRSARCAEHKKTSRAFTGVNEYGWLFRCPGWTEADVAARQWYEPTGVHYFTADAAKEIRKLNWEKLPAEKPAK